MRIRGYLIGNGNNQGINNGHIFKFTPSSSGAVVDGTRRTWVNNGWVSENSHDYSYTINGWTGTTTPTQGLFASTLDGGYPKLSVNGNLGTDGTSIGYLFTPEDGTGKEYKGQVNQLLYVDPDGYYTYDSRDYLANYNSDGTFTVREQIVSDKDDVKGFWPFGNRVYWFGMHMNTPFSMPINGQVLNPKGEKKDMVFEFSGDDDCLLYVDGVLVGDAGGVHLRSDVYINFATGEVDVSGKDTIYLDDIFRSAGRYNADDWNGHTFKDGTYHTFDMFYLERGGGQSNLHIKYNLVSTADFTGHKALNGLEEGERLLRDEFQFELIGLDGLYHSNGDIVNPETRAIMPIEGSTTGTGLVDSPKLETNTSYTDSHGNTFASQTFTTGVTEDGNINFGTLEIPDNPLIDDMTFRYIIREVPKERTHKLDYDHIK